MTQKDKYHQLLNQYVNGKLSMDERHDLEKQALDDPFFFDALEGWMAIGKNVDHEKHITTLLSKINQGKQKSLTSKIIWPIAIAASLVLLFTIGNILVNDSNQPLASTIPDDEGNLEFIEEDQQPKDESISLTTPDLPTPEESLAMEEEETSDTKSLTPQKPNETKKIINQKKKPIELPSDINNVATSETGGEMDMAIKEEELGSTPSPLSKVSPPINIPSNQPTRSIAKNNNQSSMAMVGSNAEIIDPDLDNHVRQSLFMRALKVLPGQRCSYDITFDSTLSIVNIKLVTRKNDSSDWIQKFILSYEGWKRETIPASLSGRYGYPPKQ